MNAQISAGKSRPFPIISANVEQTSTGKTLCAEFNDFPA